ncbi:polyprenol monophosphomannose synthase [Hymenobacter sp. BT491]|uniref:polyprenol monophosphomannose synthase n=1 Tax=Hymenobacter sp. BT491 TaxID=2766779 RepID=UPI001653E7D3|nr:polyprenol monophosphomannose synthase [Hymenobacter sp. BT491]MBC6989215.1 polyprenol monophosphomannose synthase [Hymenobacter sp. BT491]
MNDGLVLIPTYNERENAELIIRKVFSLPKAFDVLIIDDGSPDGTAEIVRRLQGEFPNRLFLEERRGKLGLGTAYIHGFRWALAHGYGYVFEMDADFSHNPEDLVRLYKACADDGYDMAIGSRYIQGVNVVNWPMDRVLMSWFASAYVRMITGMPIADATAGFKCYTARVLRTIPLDRIRFVGYAFQIEMKWLAYKYGFQIKEVPIIFTDRTRGTSKMSKGIFQEALFGVIQMKVASWFRRFDRRPIAADVAPQPVAAAASGATSVQESR